MNIKAIDTEYNGFRFRSRLEARWAVFMDAMGVRYEYEREGYDLDGLLYLPDFWLPQLNAHLEIKPVEPTEQEQEKVIRLASHTGGLVYIMIGQPECPNVGGNWYQNLRCELQFDGRADRITCKCPRSGEGDKGYNFDSSRLRTAYARARGYRFEHQEPILA